MAGKSGGAVHRVQHGAVVAGREVREDSVGHRKW